MDGGWALVTGASGGLGEELARQLAARGMNLILAARSADRLAAVADSIAQRCGVAVRTRACDLSRPGAAGELDR